MDIVSQLLLLSFVFAIGYAAVVAQTVALNRVFRQVAGFYSPAWLLFGAAFTITGALRVWGNIPDQLTFEQ